MTRLHSSKSTITRVIPYIKTLMDIVTKQMDNNNHFSILFRLQTF